LRQLREEAGLSHHQVANETGLVASTLFRLETAKTKPQLRTLRTLCSLYGTSPARQQELEALLRAASEETWLQPASEYLPRPYAAYIGFEREASALHNFEPSFVPGLLQTEAYARAVIAGSAPNASPEEVDGRVAARLKRQELLTRQEPLTLEAVIDEAVLHHLVGGKAVMRSQVERLREVSRRPNITLQVIPYETGAHPGMYGGFAILRFQEAQDVVYIESSANDLFLEGQEDVGRCSLMFADLQKLALSPEVSDALLAKVLEED